MKRLPLSGFPDMDFLRYCYGFYLACEFALSVRLRDWEDKMRACYYAHAK